MKILVIGGSGTIGAAVTEVLQARHEVRVAGSKSGDVRVDITNISSIEAMYQQLPELDAIVMTTGKVHFGPLAEMTRAEFDLGLNNKLMGQIQVVLTGIKYLNENGSFTLTSGILNHDPIKLGSSAALVNGAIDGFVKGAALELPRGIRINAVSPTVITEAMPEYAPFFHGFVPVDASIAAQAYCKSVEGAQTGQVYRVGYSI